MNDVPETVNVQAATTAVIRNVLPLSGLTGFFDDAFSRLPTAITSQGVAITGAAFALYRAFSPDAVDLEVGFTTDGVIEPVDDVVPASLPGGRVARVVHAGGFDSLAGSWQRLHEWIATQGLRPGAVWWEVYLTQPSPGMDPAELRTELNQPLAD